MKPTSHFWRRKVALVFLGCFFLVAVYCYATYQWDQSLGFWPRVRQYLEGVGEAYPISIQIAEATKSIGLFLITTLSSIFVGLISWITTTHILTKKAQFSLDIFEEKNAGMSIYRVAIRNSKEPSWTPKWLEAFSLFKVFDVTIYGRMRIDFQECKNLCKSDYERRRRSQMSLKLSVSESYHALIESNSKRLLNIEFANIKRDIEKIIKNSCKCQENKMCCSEHKLAVSSLKKLENVKVEDNQILTSIYLKEIMNIYPSSYIEFIAMVTGETTLRKKPISSIKFKKSDISPIGDYYQINKYSRYG